MSTLVKERPVTSFALFDQAPVHLPAVVEPRVSRYAKAIEHTEAVRAAIAEIVAAKAPAKNMGPVSRVIARVFPTGDTAVPAVTSGGALVMSGFAAAMFVEPVQLAFLAQQVLLMGGLLGGCALIVAGNTIKLANNHAKVEREDLDQVFARYDALTPEDKPLVAPFFAAAVAAVCPKHKHRLELAARSATNAEGPSPESVRAGRVAFILASVRDGAPTPALLDELRAIIDEVSFAERLDIAAVLERNAPADHAELAHIAKLAAQGLAA